MAKILWLSDGGCTTGFGRVTHSIGERLVRDFGHEIHVLAINHRGDDYPSILDPTQKTPLWLYRPEVFKTDDMYGNSRIIEMLGNGPDVVVMLNDPHMILAQIFNNQHDTEKRLLRSRPLLTYIPCDGYDLPPQWTSMLPAIGKVVTMSRFGQAQYPGSEMVYHGVDPERFWPVSEKPITVSTGETLQTKRECKKAFGLDADGFLILRVDSNSGRKDYAATIKALIPVMKRHRDVQVWFHCDPMKGTGASNLNMIISKYEGMAKRFFFPGMHSSFQGWPEQDLNALFSAADMFVSTSRGEGFGLTLAEAASAGLPIVAQNVSAIPEVVGPGGVLVDSTMRITVPSGEDVCLPDVDAFTNAIERLYESSGARRDLGQAGRRHVLESFSWDRATQQFDEFIRGLAPGDRIEPVPPPERENRDPVAAQEG
jgi:glycosyltransferase involved in cell wall biosynthesis